MRERKATSKRPGQLAGADMGAAMKLSSLLPGCGLEKLTDEEATRIIDLLNRVNDAARSEGFGYVLQVISDYNCASDARLNGDGPPMNH